MEGRLSRDVDVQQSQSSPFLIDLAPTAPGLFRHRNSEGPDPKNPIQAQPVRSLNEDS
jgi:hypothetical protein